MTGDIAVLAQKLDDNLKFMETRFNEQKEEIKSMKSEIKTDISGMRTEMTRQFEDRAEKCSKYRKDIYDNFKEQGEKITEVDKKATMQNGILIVVALIGSIIGGIIGKAGDIIKLFTKG